MTYRPKFCGGFLATVISLWVLAVSAVADTPDARLYLSHPEIYSPATITQPWRFQPGDDLSRAQPGFDDSQWGFKPIPERWPEGGYPQFGQMAWYRLTLQFDLDKVPGGRDGIGPLAVQMGKVMSAYELYVGGRRVGKIGSLPPAAQTQYDRIQVFPIPESTIADDGTVVLALRVWGGDQAAIDAWYGGPYKGGVQVGSYQALVQQAIATQLPQLVAVVLFLSFGLYHLYLYYRNRQLRLFLWFGLMAINIGLYSFSLAQWKYVFEWSFIVYQKIEFGSIHLLPAFAIQMLWAILGRPIGKWLRAYQVSFVVMGILVVLFPGLEVHYRTLPIWHLWTLPLLLYSPLVLLGKAREGNREARTMLPGVTLFALSCIGDIFLHYYGGSELSLVPYGFAAIALSMAVSLANNFSRMLGTLEEEVNKRTADLSEANMLLAEAARADPLTGLLNRRGFLEESATEVQRFYRSGRPFSIILADVDHFKRFNDKHGHACGDYVLRRIATILGERLRDVDRVARWGGEEFIMLLPETDTQGAAVLADKLRKYVDESLFHFEGETISSTMTFGVATFRNDETLDRCIARADTAMYHGKKAGRNKVMLGGFKGLTLVN
jgi:diguanylate cyclase (GGDEF)-like protein